MVLGRNTDCIRSDTSLCPIRPEKQLQIVFLEMVHAGGMPCPIRGPVRLTIGKSSNNGFWHLPTRDRTINRRADRTGGHAHGPDGPAGRRQPEPRLRGAPGNPRRRSRRPECGVTAVRASRPRLGRRPADRLRLRASRPVFDQVGCCGRAAARSGGCCGPAWPRWSDRTARAAAAPVGAGAVPGGGLLGLARGDLPSCAAAF